MVYITRRAVFSAAHRLFNPTFTDNQNEQTYDKCNNLWGHGHNYTLEVTIKGIPNPETGYLIDLKDLKTIMNEVIVSKVDHKHLNIDVEMFKGVITSLENIAAIFWNELSKILPIGELYRIKILETENNWIEYYGEPFEIKRFS